MKPERKDAPDSQAPPPQVGHKAGDNAGDAAAPTHGSVDADTAQNRGYNQRGYGKGGKLGRGEPDGTPERDGSTQPDFGQADALGDGPDTTR